MKTVGRILLVLGLTCCLFTIACSSYVEKQQAESRKFDAQARAESAAITAQVPVIEAETNAALEKLQALTNNYKDVRSFDAQMARQEFATIILEFEALKVALKDNREAIDEYTRQLDEVSGVPDNVRAAADNTWWVLTLFPIGVGAIIAVLGGLMIFLSSQTEKRLVRLEKILEQETVIGA